LKDTSEQTVLPFLVFEDVIANPSNLNFYTGKPNKGTFNTLFEEMADVREQFETPSKSRPISL
jgi:hypothetical protein